MNKHGGSFLHAYETSGRIYSEERSISMTRTVPPEDYRWTSKTVGINKLDHEIWKGLRLAFLSRYEMEVAEEGKWRYWRWLDGETQAPRGHVCQDGRRRLVVWWERRPIDAPLPLTPGLWPRDD